MKFDAFSLPAQIKALVTEQMDLRVTKEDQMMQLIKQECQDIRKENININSKVIEL